MSRRRRRATVAAVVVVAAAVLAVAGRYEDASASRAQVHGFQHVLSLAGPNWATTASAYRLATSFDCLLYARGANPYALELCFDASGRVVEAVDRRGATPHFWSLRFDPSESTLRVDPKQVLAALVAAGGAPRGSTSIPLGTWDVGPQLAATSG